MWDRKLSALCRTLFETSSVCDARVWGFLFKWDVNLWYPSLSAAHDEQITHPSFIISGCLIVGLMSEETCHGALFQFFFFDVLSDEGAYDSSFMQSCNCTYVLFKQAGESKGLSYNHLALFSYSALWGAITKSLVAFLWSQQARRFSSQFFILCVCNVAHCLFQNTEMDVVLPDTTVSHLFLWHTSYLPRASLN